MNRSIQSGCVVPPSQCVHTSWRRCCLSRRATSSPVPSLLPEILKPVLATVVDDSSRPDGGERWMRPLQWIRRNVGERE